MKRAILFLLTSVSLLAQNASPEKIPNLVERVGDTGFIQIQAESFKALSLQQKQLAYWLVQASIAVDPIIYDQLSQFGLRQKRLLEEIISHSQGIDAPVKEKIINYAKLFWANRGNHSLMTSQKFLPTFTLDELEKAAAAAQKSGALKSPYADLPPLTTADSLRREIQALRPAFFDPAFEPMITAKSPQGGKDIIQASANTFYEGLSLADLKDFHDRYPLNSRVVKTSEGKLREDIYRAGTADGKTPPGLYATFLKRTIDCLEKARSVAEAQQGEAISALIRFYQTGDFHDWIQFDSAWVQNNATVDFANGFIEVYRDARGMKASSQSFVSITDKPVTDVMVKLAQNAEYFEQKAPWENQYKKKAFQPPVVKAIETLIETGDFEVSTTGDNLPNENEIHEKYGTKNFLFTASSRAMNDATGYGLIEEFEMRPEAVARYKKFGTQSKDLMTAMHEVIGHGSGKLSDRLKGGAEPHLKEYFSTLEEARADLMALWNAWDPKLSELGLVTNQEEEAKAMYDDAALVVLTQLRRIPSGNTIEEDHQRDRALIANYLIDKAGAIQMIEQNSKTYVIVKDYVKMRAGVGQLLSELMRIKAEGDYAAIKALIDKYAVHFDPALRDQVMARFQKLNIPSFWAGINPELNAEMGNNGQITNVAIRYPCDAVHQYLYYGSMYDDEIARILKIANK